MQRLMLSLAAIFVVSMALLTSIAAANSLTVAQAHREIEQKAKRACALTCDAFGVRTTMRISAKKVSAMAFVRRESQTCTDRMIVTRTSTAGLRINSDPYPAGWTCR